jgi:hypothetical protein
MCVNISPIIQLVLWEIDIEGVSRSTVCYGTTSSQEPIPSTILRYNASAVKVRNAKSCLVRYENKNIFLLLRKNALAYYSATVNS